MIEKVSQPFVPPNPRNRPRLSVEELLAHPTFQIPWYHQIEFYPGLFSPGRKRANVLLARKMLQGCEIKGQRVLDIGAMDGLMTLLALRREAARVVTHDRMRIDENILLLKNFFGVDFDYVAGQSLNALPSISRALDAYPFDLVIFSGVLYHMFDPMAGLAQARGLVRNGGLVVIETAAVIDSGYRMHFNAGGRFYPGTNYWMMSLDCLDYLCRFLRLVPLDCAYLNSRMSSETNLQICRIALTCRAVDHGLSIPKDDWFNEMAHAETAMTKEDFDEFMNFDELTVAGKRDLAYESTTEGLIRRSDTDTIDLYKSVVAMAPTKRKQGLLEKLCLDELY